MGQIKKINLRKVLNRDEYSINELRYLIRVSYKKLKSSVYYDSSNMFLRRRLAEYESEEGVGSLNTKLDKLATMIYNGGSDDLINLIIENIDYYCVPKKVEDNGQTQSGIISNYLIKEKFKISKMTFFIKLDIEAHILGVLWILITGKKIENTYSDTSYANILAEGYDVSQIKLFKPYYKQYTQWRDKAVKNVEQLVENKKEALLISLDIKEYYYNANIDFEKLRETIGISDVEETAQEVKLSKNKLLLILTKLIEKVFEKYGHKLIKDTQKTIIPIGFLPSTIIGNWYLKDFDQMIRTKLQPLYYGRYVDDLLFVIHKQDKTKFEENKDVIKEYFVNRDILEEGFVVIPNNGTDRKYYNLYKDSSIEKFLECIDVTTDSNLKDEIYNNIYNKICSKNIKNNINRDSIIAKYNTIDDVDIIQVNEFIIELIISNINDGKIKGMLVYKLLEKNESIYIQDEKIKIYNLSHRGSNAIISNFKRELQENASVFKFLPEKSEIVESFEKEIFEVEYSGSVNKIGSIDGFKLNKYNLSKYLARVIYSDKLDNQKYLSDTNNQILSVFDNNYCIELYSMWEKVLVYFLVNSQKVASRTFLKNIIKSLEKVTIELDPYQTYVLRIEKNDLINKLKYHLMIHLRIILGMIGALDNTFFGINNNNVDIFIENTFNVISDNERLNNFRNELVDISKDSLYFKYSNLLRHNYIVEALVNYTNLIKEETGIDKLGIKKINITCSINSEMDNYRGFRCNLNNECYKEIIEKKCNKLCEKCSDSNIYGECYFSINKASMEYSPRFVHLHECILYLINYKIAHGEVISGIDYLGKANDLFRKINFMTFEDDDLDIDLFSSYDCEANVSVDNYLYEFLDINKFFDKYPYDKNDYLYRQKEYNINYINVAKNRPRNKLKVALVNMEVNDGDISSSFLNKPNIDNSRLENIYRLLNDAIRKNADIIIFPEVSIPYYWLSAIANYSRQHNIAVICGLEHIVYDNNTICNYMVSILPCSNNYSSAVIKLRLKNHYSPREKKFVRGHKRKEPAITNGKEYDLFTWRGINFAVYNCFELANIKDRSLFVSHVDILIGLVHNKDINYYSNIVESLSRDIHCYFIQANNSRYGDSRITRPSKSSRKNMLQVSGGDSDSVLICDVDIESLRDFQILDYELQLESDEFKPTPPEFNSMNVKIRHKLPLP